MLILVRTPWLIIALLILRKLSSYLVPMARQRLLHWQPKGFAYPRRVYCCAFMYSLRFSSISLLSFRLLALPVNVVFFWVDHLTKKMYFFYVFNRFVVLRKHPFGIWIVEFRILKFGILEFRKANSRTLMMSAPKNSKTAPATVLLRQLAKAFWSAVIVA